MPIGTVNTSDQYALGSTQWMCRRQNPGGTSPLIDGKLLAFAGTIDIQNVLDETDRAIIKVKFDDGPVLSGSANFGSVDKTNLTPTAAANVLNTLALTGAEWGIDTDTGRLQLTGPEGTQFIQVWSELAGALNFGACRHLRGFGCYFYAGFLGYLVSATPTINWNEDTTIEAEDAQGQKLIYTRPGSRGTAQISVVEQRLSLEMKQMVDGGLWIPAQGIIPERYDPPNAEENPNERRVDVHIFKNIYETRSNTAGSHTKTREDIYIGCTGHSTETESSGAWTTVQYDWTAASYIDANKKEQNSPRSNMYTRAQWEALNLKQVLVSDWSNA